MNRTRGLTLIEVIVGLALIVAAAMLMYSFFGQGFSLYTAETASADDQMNMRQAMSDITNIVRITDASQISVSSGVLTVGTRKYSLSGGNILRDSSVIARKINTFSVSISNNMLDIRIVNTNGTAIETSLSLASS